MSTSTLPPSSEAAIAPTAAAVVVLPTPPEPQVMTISFVGAQLGEAGRHGQYPSSAPSASDRLRVARTPWVRVNR